MRNKPDVSYYADVLWARRSHALLTHVLGRGGRLRDSPREGRGGEGEKGLCDNPREMRKDCVIVQGMPA